MLLLNPKIDVHKLALGLRANCSSANGTLMAKEHNPMNIINDLANIFSLLNFLFLVYIFQIFIT